MKPDSLGAKCPKCGGWMMAYLDLRVRKDLARAVVEAVLSGLTVEGFSGSVTMGHLAGCADREERKP